MRAQTPPPAAAGKQPRKLTKEQGQALKAHAVAAERAKTKNAKERAAAAKKKKEQAELEKFVGKPGEFSFSGEGASVNMGDGKPIVQTRSKRKRGAEE